MSGVHLAAAARADDITLTLAGDYAGIPEESNYRHILRVGVGGHTEFVTYERRVGPTLIGVARGWRRLPQNAGEVVVPEAEDGQLAFGVALIEALAEAYGVDLARDDVLEVMRRFGTRELDRGLVTDLVAFIRGHSASESAD